jgi:hypothetical protein
MRRIISLSAVVVALGLVVVGCKDESSTTVQSTGQSQQAGAPAEAIPAGLILAQAPEKATDVLALKQAKAGDEVVLHGKVGGRVAPFVDGRAVFQVVDATLQSCKDIPGDTCATPWDYCCDPDINKKSASIQVVGADGKPLRANLKGVGGLKELSDVTIKGTVAQAGEAGPVIVNATGIYVKG